MRTPIDWTACGLWLGAAALILMAGCGDNEQIRRYQIPHESSAATDRPKPAAATQRSLAAIVPNDGQAWFFKALDPADRIQPIVEDFEQLLESVTFVDGKPQWVLPAGWTQAPGNQFRFMTLKAGRVDVAVSSLSLPPGGDFDQYALANVNRWLGQVGLPDVTAAELGTVTRKLTLADGTAVLFDSGVSSDQPPMAKSDAAADKSGDSGSVASNGLTYDVPDGWQPGGRRPMRLATFFVKDDGKQLEITLSRLGVNPGSMLANVNRWRRQIGLDDIDQAQLDEAAQSLEIEGLACKFFQLDNAEGTQQAIYVVVVKRPDHTLFVKMMGDRALATAEKDTFERFVESIRFSS